MKVARRYSATSESNWRLVVLSRATRLAKINTKLAAAQAAGALQFFNQEYQRRRRQAQAQGKGFMSYATARKRLERVLAGVVAGGISAVYVVRTFRTVGLAI